MKTVAVVGGGIAGLSVAEALARREPSIQAIVLEAAGEPGGKIISRREDGFVVETGPHGFLDKEPKALQMVERLQLTGSMIRANEASANRYIVRGGKLRKVPSSPPGFITSDILPLWAKLRIALEPFIRAKRSADEESIWAFARRRLGRAAADVLVDAFVTGIYGGDPKRLSAQAAFPRLIELENKYGGLIRAQIAIAKERKAAGREAGATGAPAGTLHSFEAGLGTLTQALAAKLDVRCDHGVERITTADGRYRVEGAGAAVGADAVVVTTPAFTTADLLAPMVDDAVGKLREIAYVPVAVVVHGYRADDVGHALAGFGFLCPGGEGRAILGSIWASTVFAGHAPDGTVMLRTMLGGARNPGAAAGTDDEILARARDELVALMGLSADARPVFERVMRWPEGIPQYEHGHAGRVAAADAIEDRLPGVFLGGNALRGVAMIQCIADGDRVCDRVLAHLQGG